MLRRCLFLGLVGVSAVFAACEDGSGSPSGSGFAFDAGSFDGGGIAPPPSTDGGGVDAATDGDVDAANDAGVDASDGGFVFGPNDRAVDPLSGLDTNAGTLAAPYKTLVKALTGRPSGASVVLFGGTYDATNQGGGTITVPNGVTLRAQNASVPVLVSQKLTLVGGATLLDVTLDQASQLTATTGVTTLSGVRFRSTNDSLTLQATLMLGGTAQVTVTPGTLPGGVETLGAGALGPLAELTGTAKLLVQGGVFDGNNVATGAAPIIVQQSAELVVDGATFQKLGLTAGNPSCAGILSVGNSPAAPAKVTIRNLAKFDGVKAPGGSFDCPAVAAGANSTLLVDNAIFTNGGAAAITAAANATDVSVTIQGGATFTANPSAVDLSFSGGTNTLKIAKATFTNNTNGGNSPVLRVNYTSTNNDIDISQLTMTNNTGGSILYPRNLKVRSSTITGNTSYAFQIYGTPLSVDLGTALSPGGNTIQNSGTGNLSGITGGAISAVGNTWNPNVQGADANGHFPAATQLPGPTSGANFTLDTGSLLSL